MKTALLLLLGGFLCGLHGAEGQDPDLLSMITQLQTRVQTLETKDQFNQTEAQSLQNEVQSLKTQDQALKNQIQTLETKDQTHQTEVQALKTQIQDLETKDQTHQTEVQALKNQIQDLETKDQTHQTEVQALKNQTQDLETKDQTHQTEVQALKNQIQSLEISQAQLQTGSPVAFYVHLTVDGFTLTLNEPIKYDQVVTNVGGAYSTDTGNFTAPLKGLYVFSIFVFTTGNTELIDLRLMVNNRYLAYVYGMTNNPDIRETSTAVAVDTLEAGDTVYVMPAEQKSSSGHKEFQTIFCGFLLSPM